MREMDNVDKTIDAICDWICERAKVEKYGSVEEDRSLKDMVLALAELVSARAKINPEVTELGFGTSFILNG